MAEFDPDAKHAEERDGQQFLTYDCGCFAYCTPEGEMKISPCESAHERPVVAAVRAMLDEAGLKPTRETRESMIKH